MEDEFYLTPGFMDIPPLLFDSETNGPIRFCKICGKDLIESNSDYLIQKSFRRFPEHRLDEVVFEFAICSECNRRMHNELSEESKKMMGKYMEEEFHASDPVKRMMMLSNEEEPNLRDLTDHCAVTGKPLDELEEYTIIAQGKGPRLVLGILPLTVSYQAQEDLNELLSQKTRDFLDGFTKEHFSGPPGIEELIGPRRPMFV